MPIYEYECENCGRVDEAIQKFSDKPLSQCRFCNGKLHKLISHSAFHLKGTGWYVTDYAGKKVDGTQTVGGNEGTPKTEGGSSAGKATESKSD